MLLSWSGNFLNRSLGPLTPRSQILDDGGEGVLETNLTGERVPDRDRECGKGDFVIDLDFDPEPEGDLDLGLDFDEAVIEAGPGGLESSLSLGSTDDDLDLDEDASRR